MNPSITYDESEINNILQLWLSAVGVQIGSDHVTLRRELVDAGYLVRDADGRSYRLAEPPRPPVSFAADVENVNILIADRDFVERREANRRARFPRPDEEAGRRILQARRVAIDLLENRLDADSALKEMLDIYDEDRDKRCPVLSRLSMFRWMQSELRLDYSLSRLYEPTETIMQDAVREFLISVREWEQAVGYEGEM